MGSFVNRVVHLTLQPDSGLGLENVKAEYALTRMMVIL